jgi:hypothetical protein
MPPRRRLGPNAPLDDDNPHTNLPPSFPARFMTVLELYRAQRDTPSQVQAAPPSPTFVVQYQPDAPPVHHTLFAILSSQATVVAQEELTPLELQFRRSLRPQVRKSFWKRSNVSSQPSLTSDHHVGPSHGTGSGSKLEPGHS